LYEHIVRIHLSFIKMESTMNLFDTHAHIGLIHEDPIEQLFIAKEAEKENITHIISICNNLRDLFELHKNLEMAKNVYFAAGVSPSEVDNPGIDWEQTLDTELQKDKVIALGETGLDYYRRFGNKNSQIELFVKQLELADHYDVPAIIHNREAGRDILDILESKIPGKGGVLHCYSEDWNFAKKALDLDLYFSFAGNVTYRNARNLHDTVRNLPLDRIVIESESPFMIPSQYKGKRNRPIYLHATARFIAEIRQEDDEEVINALYHNSLRLFGFE